jgi:hypothetical protein
MAMDLHSQTENETRQSLSFRLHKWLSTNTGTIRNAVTRQTTPYFEQSEKMNAYLKEIAGVCEINKELTLLVIHALRYR